MAAGHFNTRINIKFYLSPVSNRTLSVSEKILHLRNGLRIWRRTRDLTEKTGNLTEGWWKTDRGSQYFDTLPFITHTRALFGIFGTKLICFTFCEAPSIEHEHKRKYWVFWHESVTDGLMVSLEGLTAFATSRGLALPIPMIPAHMWTGHAFFSILTMEQTSLYASPLNILGQLFILNIEPNSVVTCPFYRPIPAPMLISELNRDQISLMWDIIYGQININMWTTSVKINREKTWKNTLS